ncbi:MAG: transketolase, partial [Bacteroidetes bacterium]
MNKSIETKAADNIRILAAAMVEKAKSGHPGGAMGGADFINILYTEFLNYDPSDMAWNNRDRFFLDPGHMSPMLYATLALAGFYSMDDLKNFRQWESVTPGHPEVDVLRGVENTSGPLGQGHTMAVGAAIAERFLVQRFGNWMSHKIYTFISDGGVQEEISQGAGRIAGFLGLSNLIMFYDSNDIQLSTNTDEVTVEDTAKKYEAWGWRVMTIDGNNSDQIRTALKIANAETEKPTLIIGKTIMGKGAVTASGESYERKCATHGMPLGEAGASFEKSIENLGGNPENPFVIFEEVAELYSGRKVELLKAASAKKAEQSEWEASNPELAVKLKNFFSSEAPAFDYASLEQKPNSASRASSSAVLAAFAGKIENMIVSSADLSNSDKTDGFLKKTTAFKKGDFSGSFLQAGVSELTMACLA